MEPAVQSRATEKPDASARKDRRLRAVYRRELQNSVFYSALIVSVGIAAAMVASALLAPAAALAYAVVTLPLVIAALAVAHVVRSRGRRYVIPLGMLIGLLPGVSTAASVLLVQRPEFALGTLGLIPIAFAVFVPFERRPHLTWLVLADCLFLVVVAGMVYIGAGSTEVVAMLAGGGMASALSVAANEIQLRRRRQMNGQLLAVRGLYSRMKEHELDLRRQDEFLFMQQETLVVQQAELLRLNEELESIARLDALTGLGNRLRLNEDLAQMAGRIERNGGTAGVLLLDLDRFKRLNDSAGHLAGDAALRGVADALRKTSRVGDGVYRYGGEEFLVLLHDCDQGDLHSAGQRYISAIQASGMPHPDNQPYGVVTASAGATELSQANCTDVDSALHDADAALYVAKARGRNRLEIHARPMPADVVPLDQQRTASQQRAAS
jgi:diguanylate cyclase (GGDEF)-like protein